MPVSASIIDPTQQQAAMAGFPNGSVNAGRYTLIFRIRQKDSNAILKQHALILFPATMTSDTESLTSLYYTKGGIVADTPSENAVGMTVFSISGHTGFRGITAPFTAPGGERVLPPGAPEVLVATVQSVISGVTSGQRLPAPRSYIDGAAAIKDLQDTLLGYMYPAGQPETAVVTQPQDLQLEFLNLSAPTSLQDPIGFVGWRIHPHRNLVTIRQDARQPFLYHYQLQFAALAPLAIDVPDLYVQEFTNPRTGFQQTLDMLIKVVQDTKNGVNTIVDAFDQFSIANVTGPITTLLSETRELGNALGNFIGSGASKIAFPLYARRTLQHVLDAPRHSVTTLKEAAKGLGALLVEAADPRSLATLLTPPSLVAGVDDDLTLALNGETPRTLALGNVIGGAAVAEALQTHVRALTPEHPSNAAAYRDFTATFVGTQLRLSSGTKGSDAGQVTVIVPPDPLLAPTDASAVLGLGLANGGQEQAGSAYGQPALALLRGLEEACTHLQAFPDFFAAQLEEQDAQLAAHLPTGTIRPQVRGEQRLRQTRITPGDSLQAIAARVGVPPETLALVNRLTYPYIIEAPSTLVRSRISSATPWVLTDVVQGWPVDAFQGQRVDLLSGPGAGQSRRILRNTATQLVLEFAWTVQPNDTTNYAIRSAANPILRTGAVSAATDRTLEDTSMALVPESQRGLTLLVMSGATAGERRRVVANDALTCHVEPPWDVIPAPGSLYAVLGPEPATRRHKLVGEALSVPQTSAQTAGGVRSRVQDVSAITGHPRSVEEQLFGRDLLLVDRALVWDAALADCATIAGLPNLKQALIHYINLPLGELEYAPTVGSFVAEEIGLGATLDSQVQLLHSVDRTVRQDARIARMQGAALVSQGGMAVISFGAQAIDGSSVDRIVVR